MDQKLVIKPAAREELDVLNDRLKSYIPHFHEKKIDWQDKGEASWLIAWMGEEPVGHILIKWNGVPDSFVKSNIEEQYPFVQNLAVKITHQRKGIGTQLVNMAEQMIKDRKHTKVGMAVSSENDSARKLYEKLGYKDWQKGTYKTNWKSFDQNNKEIEESETCTYLVKEL